MANAELAINGCQIFLGHPDPAQASAAAKAFKVFFINTMNRARSPNLSDMYEASFKLRENFESRQSNSG